MLLHLVKIVSLVYSSLIYINPSLILPSIPSLRLQYLLKSELRLLELVAINLIGVNLIKFYFGAQHIHKYLEALKTLKTLFESHLFLIVISPVDVAEDDSTHFSKIILGDVLVNIG